MPHKLTNEVKALMIAEGLLGTLVGLTDFLEVMDLTFDETLRLKACLDRMTWLDDPAVKDTLDFRGLLIGLEQLQAEVRR